MPLPPTDLARLIREDHIKAETLFGRIESGRGNRVGQFAALVHDVSLHAGGEENVFYVALRELPDGKHHAEDAFAEHQIVKDALVVVDRGEPGDPTVEDAVRTVIEVVRRHAREEEEVLLPALRAKVGDDRMQELGAAFVEAKAKAPTRAHPHAPTAPGIEAVASAPAALLDKMKDKLGGRVAMFASDGSGLLDPQAQQIVDALAELGPKPIELQDPGTARKQPTAADAVRAVLEAQNKSTDPEPVELVQDRTIETADRVLSCRLYVPAADAKLLPVIVYVHGGGWVIADLDTYDASCRALANKAGAIVVSVEYRHAPEHKFPAAHDDILAATRWILANAEGIGGDSARVAIVGESAGGNMAMATCLSLLQYGEALPAAQVLVYPVASAEPTESYIDSADAVPLNSAMMTWFARHTFEEPSHATDFRFDLVNTPADQLAKMPPTLVITAERDPLRVEGQTLAQRLSDAGASCEHLHVDGVMHEFFGTGAVLDKAAMAVDHAAAFLQKAFTPATVRT